MAIKVGKVIFRKRQKFKELARQPRHYELEFCVVLPDPKKRVSARGYEYEMFCAARRARRIAVRRLARLIDDRPIVELIPILRVEFHNVMEEVFEKKLLPRCDFEGKIDWRRFDESFVMSCLPYRPEWADDYGWNNIGKAYKYAFYHSYIVYAPT